MKHVIPVGTTEPQDFALLDDGEAVVGTGFTLGLRISQKVDGAYVALDVPPTVAWLSQAAGTVRVSGAGALAIGSYLVRYTLTDGGGKVGFVPNGEKADLWQVVAVANY